MNGLPTLNDILHSNGTTLIVKTDMEFRDALIQKDDNDMKMENYENDNDDKRVKVQQVMIITPKQLKQPKEHKIIDKTSSNEKTLRQRHKNLVKDATDRNDETSTDKDEEEMAQMAQQMKEQAQHLNHGLRQDIACT